MKNLTIVERSSRVLDFLESQMQDWNYSKILHAVNCSTNDSYIISKCKFYKIPSNYEEDIKSFDIDEDLEFISLEYCRISEELYGACKSGRIMRINVESEFKYELITELNIELQSMKLSPDHEMIVIVTVNDIVITMVSTFQIISEVDLHVAEFGQKQFVTVGWGKKETQFHGTEGKKAAIAKPIEMNKNESDDGSCRISWRDDGSLFAVGFLHRESRVRQFKVFNREGVLQYTSEYTNGLEEPLSWKPSGSLIATTQVSQNKYLVALFEKNGLKHREFALPFKLNEVKVKDLFWSPCSEILAVWSEIQEDRSSILQLWTENNYHWYLKQSIKFPINEPLVYATWKMAFPSKKLILLTFKELVTLEYNWSVNHSRGTTVIDKSVIGVIDGNKVLMTGLRVGIVPPPMAHQTLETTEPINNLAFAPELETGHDWIDSNAFFCVSNSNKLIFYKHQKDPLLRYEHVGTYDIECEKSFYNMHHFLWLDENTVLCSTSANNQSFLCVLTLDSIDQAQGQITVSHTHAVDGLIQQIIPSPDPKEAYIIIDYFVVKYTKEKELLPIGMQLEDVNFSKVEVVKINKKHAVLSLNHWDFRINGKQICNTVTSFFVHSEFLLLTTVHQTLISVRLNEEDFEELSKHDLTVKPWENNANGKSFSDIDVRRVERGSYLIAAISKDSKTILQMPRGNLECVQPRALSLYINGMYLDKCDYTSAFDLMRRQRINLNLIYDYDPKKFLENADKFVEQVSKASWLSLFLSELTDEDVTTTIYGSYYRKNRSSANIDTNKIKTVCGLLRKIMEERNNADQFTQPILISLVKEKEKQGIESALVKIKEIRNLEENSATEERIKSDEALKYLLYIVDVNVLFDIALGMYDFDLTMFIASRSQKDPKEYVPFLNDLKKLDETYMKYSIDLHLKRYESALRHIARDPNRFNECINLIRNQNLHKKALRLFDKDSEQYKEVARNYGELLQKKQHYLEAGIMFERSGNFKEALNAYKLAGSWQDVVTLSVKMGLRLISLTGELSAMNGNKPSQAARDMIIHCIKLTNTFDASESRRDRVDVAPSLFISDSEPERQLLYKNLVERLKADKKYEEAAHVSINYLKDVGKAVVCLCSGKRWKDVVRIAHDTNNLDLIESRIKSSVYEFADHTMSQIEKSENDFEQYRSRLTAVRQNISRRNLKPYNEICENESMGGRGISDILSDTSSVTGSASSQRSKSSNLSGKSYRSSKNRRKQERKISSLREGNVFEDVALIQALYQIISSVYREKENFRSLIQMLVYFGDDEYAERIQSRIEQFLILIEKSKSEIWDKSAPSSLTEMENAEFMALSDLQGLSACQRLVEPYVTNPPLDNSLPWKLNIF